MPDPDKIRHFPIMRELKIRREKTPFQRLELKNFDAFEGRRKKVTDDGFEFIYCQVKQALAFLVLHVESLGIVPCVRRTIMLLSYVTQCLVPAAKNDTWLGCDVKLTVLLLVSREQFFQHDQWPE